MTSGDRRFVLPLFSVALMAGCASTPEVRRRELEKTSMRACAVEGLDPAGRREFFVRCPSAPVVAVHETNEGSCAGRYQPPVLKKKGQRPRYTMSAVLNEVAGEGRYACLVDEAGGLARCTVEQSLGEMDARVIEAFGTATFEPARCESSPVAGRIELSATIALSPRCTQAKEEAPSPVPEPAEKKKGLCELAGAAPAPMIRPTVISGPPPEYTQEANELGQEGTIIAQCVLPVTGDLTNCEIRCSNVPLMDAVVLDALEAWKMTPARCGDVPVPTKYVVPVRLVASKPPPIEPAGPF